MDQHETTPTQATQKSSSLGVPIAIVFAAAIVAGAILYNGQSADPVVREVTPGAEEDVQVVVEPVTAEDHIRGNPNAPILMVEYSDYDCPFCKNFHETMNRIMDEFGTDGRVAWVYRHFPLNQLHPNASRIAEAAECVAELGGNEAFWRFSDLVFGERSQNEPTNMTRLPEFAVDAGVDQRAFETCLESGRYTEPVLQDVAEAIKAGGQGTPHTVVMIGDQQAVINGAQPYEYVRQVVQSILTQIEGGQLPAATE